MPRPRFSEMLVERRHQLGLSIEQASKVLKLREQVLIAFEEGDYPAIPKSGYAQGMLSSYARYLGLNPRDVVDQFQEDLYEHTNGSSSHELGRRTRQGRSSSQFGEPTYEVPQTQSSGKSNLPGPTHLLPDNPQLGIAGEFDSTSPVRRRSDTWRQSSPLVSGRTYLVQSDRTGSLRYPGTYGQGQYPQRPQLGDGSQRQTGYGSRSYNGQSAYDAYSRQRSRRSSQHYVEGDSQPRNAGRSVAYGRDDVISRDVSASQYDDDLRVSNDARPYRAASTRQGRSTSRDRSTPQRPNVRRRSGDAGRRQLQGRASRPAPQQSGLLGFLQVFFSDSRRTMATVIVALIVALVLIFSMAVKSCVSPIAGDNKQMAVSSVTTQQSVTSQAATTQAATTAVATSTSAATTEATPATVTVKVADGAVSWVEIDNGGKSEVAETVTGPWEKTFTVNQTLTIQVADTTAVTVTRDGEKVKFDELSSGVGTLTIEGPKISATTAATAASTVGDNSYDDGTYDSE